MQENWYENLTRSARPEEPMELSAVVGAKK